ncbi:MAG: type II toxin-antitoxin system VapC family toxin [Actinomycetota bacterium]
MLVVDPTVVLPILAAGTPWAGAGEDDLVAPPLLWSECRSLLHDLARRGVLPAPEARRLRRALDRAPITELGHPQLGEEAWRMADLLNHPRTEAAEYVALARLTGAPLATLDRDLAARAAVACRVRPPG